MPGAESGALAHWRLRPARSPAPEELRALESMSGIAALRITGDDLIIEYDRRMVALRAILARIGQMGLLLPSPLIGRLRHALACWIDDNLREHLLYAAGWRAYLDAIYLAAAPRPDAGARPAQWRQRLHPPRDAGQ
jgi:hypothetical protein